MSYPVTKESPNNLSSHPKHERVLGCAGPHSAQLTEPLAPPNVGISLFARLPIIITFKHVGRVYSIASNVKTLGGL
jgi:hypothetical protein